MQITTTKQELDCQSNCNKLILKKWVNYRNVPSSGASPKPKMNNHYKHYQQLNSKPTYQICALRKERYH